VNALVDVLTVEHPELLIVVGGRLQHDVNGLVMHLPEGIAASAAALATRLMG
jgi:hypothetical protein